MAPHNTARQPLTLDHLPIEVLSNIFWQSRELSLIHVNRKIHASLPPYSVCEKSLAISAFCAENESALASGYNLHKAANVRGLERHRMSQRLLPSPVDRGFMEKYKLPRAAELSFPLSNDERQSLRKDIFESHWFSVRVFQRLHEFLFLEHIYQLKRLTHNSNHPLPRHSTLQKILQQLKDAGRNPSFPENFPVHEILDLSLKTDEERHVRKSLHIPRNFHAHVYRASMHVYPYNLRWNIFYTFGIPEQLYSVPLTRTKLEALRYLVKGIRHRGGSRTWRINKSTLDSSISDAIRRGDIVFLNTLFDLWGKYGTSAGSDATDTRSTQAMKDAHIRTAIFSGRIEIFKIVYSRLSVARDWNILVMRFLQQARESVDNRTRADIERYVQTSRTFSSSYQ